MCSGVTTEVLPCMLASLEYRLRVTGQAEKEELKEAGSKRETEVETEDTEVVVTWNPTGQERQDPWGEDDRTGKNLSRQRGGGGKGKRKWKDGAEL